MFTRRGMNPPDFNQLIGDLQNGQGRPGAWILDAKLRAKAERNGTYQPFAIGRVVTISGLVKSPELNGSKAVVKGPGKSGRLPVQIEVEGQKKIINVKYENLGGKDNLANSLDRAQAALLAEMSLSDDRPAWMTDAWLQQNAGKPQSEWTREGGAPW